MLFSLSSGHLATAKMAGDQGTELVAKTYGNDVVMSLSSLRDSGDLCDFTLYSEGRSFQVNQHPVHIMIARSHAQYILDFNLYILLII